MVMAALGASPVNRLETETPSSASSPRPVLARFSMIEASSGRLATRTRPSSRSYQRKAGTPSALPWRMACWLAGVVHGTWTVHSCNAWLPWSSHRLSVGIVPDCCTHCMTGKDTPSSWRNTTPSTSGSEISPALIRSRLAAKDSSVPALASHTRGCRRRPRARPPRPPSRTSRTTRPGRCSARSASRRPGRTAWPAATAIHPMAAATSTRIGRTTMPTSPVTAAATSSGHHEVWVNPGSSAAVRSRARKVSIHVRRSLSRSNRRRPRPVGGGVEL